MRLKKKINPKVRRSFTLLELLVVIAIMLIVGILVIGSMGGLPSMATAKTVADQLEKMYSSASLIASRTGKTVNIAFYEEDYCFRIINPNFEKAVEDNTLMSEDAILRRYTFHVSPAVSMRFDDPMNPFAEDEEKSLAFSGRGGEAVVYGLITGSFFPDGTASVKRLIVKAGKQEVLIGVSPLTGQTQRTVISDELLQEQKDDEFLTEQQ